MRMGRPGKSEGGGARRPRALIVDDEADILELLELTLLRMGLDVERAASVAEARARLDAQGFDLCLTDMRLPDGDGLELVRHIGSHLPQLPVAVITAYGSMENAIAVLKAGAFDYLSKPVALDQLRGLVHSVLHLADPVAEPSGEHGLLGNSSAMDEVRHLIDKLARSQAPVYLTGESGSGKELAARRIHQLSARRERPFVAVNCGAIPETLVESEFFGYRKGAFTGADHDKDGFFQAANGGTLFLDEVAELPLLMQVKLLRAIQEKKVRKVGCTQEDPVDVRILSATHQNLGKCVEAGRFRQDLYYRLNVISLRMPPLREMPEDIPLIAQAVLERLAVLDGQPASRLSGAAQRALQAYAFPGNVRELENILERGVALSAGGLIETLDLGLDGGEEPLEAGSAPGEEGGGLTEYLEQVERRAIQDALEKTRYNKTAAARLLGITFRALRYRMERLGMEK